MSGWEVNLFSTTSTHNPVQLKTEIGSEEKWDDI